MMFTPKLIPVKVDSPCKDCEQRHRNCWSECESYKQFKKDREREYEKMRSAYLPEQQFDSYIISNYRARKERKRRRRK